MSRIVESDAPPDEKSRLLVAVVANMILTGAMLAVSYGDLKNTRGRVSSHVGKAADSIGDANCLTLALLDDDTLKALRGAADKDLDRLADILREDPSALARIGGRADLLPALKLARGSKAIDLELAHVHLRLQRVGVGHAEVERLVGAMQQGGIAPARIPRFSDATLKHLTNPVVLDQLEAVASLQQAGRVKGLADWIEFGAAKAEADLHRVVYELREACRQTVKNPGAIVNIGGDARASFRPSTSERTPSYDMTVETPNAQVIASVEVTEVKAPLYLNADLADGIRHAIGKVRTRIADGAPVPGQRHATVVGELS